MVMQSEEQKKSLESAISQYEEQIDDHLVQYLIGRGIGEATALSRRLGMVKTPAIPEHKRAVDRLAIPYLTPAGPVAITFRCVKDHKCKDENLRVKSINPKWSHSKYWRPAGQPAYLYGVASLFDPSMDIAVTEGEIDSIILSDECGVPAVGVPGVKNWKPWWPLIFSDFRKVFVFGDGDEAGDSMTAKFVKELGQRVVPVRLPAGNDVNSLYLEVGAAGVKALMEP